MDAIRTILLTTDLSETSQKAVAPTLLLARKFGARVLLAYVSGPFPPMVEEYYVALDVGELRRNALKHARQDLTEFAAKNLGGVEVQLEIVEGVPHVEIVNLARERAVDLIVMATHGRGFISHAILGSTTERVVRRAPCPVLVVRDPQGSTPA